MLLTMKMCMIQKILSEAQNAAGKFHITEQNKYGATSRPDFYKDNSLCGTPLIGVHPGDKLSISNLINFPFFYLLLCLMCTRTNV